MRHGILRDYSATVSTLTRVLDVALVAGCGWLAHTLRFDGQILPNHDGYEAVILIGALLAALLFPVMGLYQSWRARGLSAPVGRVLSSTFLLFLLLVFVLALVHQIDTFSRLWFTYWAAATGLAMIGLRITIYRTLRTLRARGYNTRNVIVIGCGPKAEELLHKTRQNSWAGFHVSAVFGRPQSGATPVTFPVTSLDALADYVNRHTVDEAWIALPFEHAEELRTALEALRTSSANVRYAPDVLGLYLLNHGVSNLLEMPMIDLSASPIQGVNRLVKAIEDRVLAALILALSLPLMLVIAIAIRLNSPGPVIFRQKRHGWDGREIEIWKFRTMRVHREADGRVTQARPRDPRVTPLGAWLRRTSLDELPQLINVLQGHMSLVGPRPHAVQHNFEYKQLIDRYMLRHKVKPGLTGWAQINGWRGQTETLEKMQRRIEYDLYYIENWSLWFDIKIIVLTLLRGFVHQNAY